MILYSPPDSLFIFLCPFFIFNGVVGHVPAVTPQRDPPAAPRGRAPTTRPGDPGAAHGGSLSSSGSRGSRRAAVWPHLSIARAFANSGAAFLNLTTNSRNLAVP